MPVNRMKQVLLLGLRKRRSNPLLRTGFLSGLPTVKSVGTGTTNAVANRRPAVLKALITRPTSGHYGEPGAAGECSANRALARVISPTPLGFEPEVPHDVAP